MRLGDIGEFLLVEKILKKIRKEQPEVIVGPGDDAFVVKMSTDKALVVTKDLLVENIHFDLRYINFFSLGYKSMMVNLSDLAAMGGARPSFAVVGLAMPVDILVKSVDNLYSGMLKAGKDYAFYIAGGDTVASKKDIVISITLFGEIDSDRVITRKGAEPGDLILTSGYFGDSAAGLRILQKQKNARNKSETYLIKKHLSPRPRFDYADILSKHRLATSLIDSSDGLAASLKFIAQNSQVGMNIFMEKIPVSRALQNWARGRSADYFWSLVLAGGEEYELVFTTKPENLSRLKQFGLRPYVIGEVSRQKTIRYFLNGRKYKYSGCGFEHFRG